MSNGNRDSDKSRLDTKINERCSKMRLEIMRYNTKFKQINSSTKFLCYSRKYNSFKSTWLKIRRVWLIFTIKIVQQWSNRIMLFQKKGSILLIKSNSWLNKLPKKIGRSYQQSPRLRICNSNLKRNKRQHKTKWKKLRMRKTISRKDSKSWDWKTSS